MAQEIERRFLVRDVRILDGRRGEPIIQGYLAKEVGSMSTRVRIRGERAFLTLKSPKQGFSRDEFEYPIPVDDAHQMIVRHCAGRVVRKTRYLVDHAHHVFEVDVFQGHHAGLVVAEVELPHEETPLCLPHWIGDEITHDSQYGNFTLAEQAALLHGTPHRTHAAPTPVVVAPRSLPAAH
ncbi:MAG TPA: CYTH domain-containing protein [Thauera aminoaromatica]|jgi:adenylate cyclase|uniref:Adenylate cyclase n=2 Tax=Thauera aminoaromatica TaxID=164330 RepID=C4ZL19_THASP|nr:MULTISPECIES: CYTH domain-containing protein [Thauera]MBL8462603.1 CYTH domain-containing protein [Thauera sp.]MDA0234849.1 CYTH domain-containing protein [Pseudomonadota bacterium]OPZ06205.1 MAG: CYTH domain protein [Alphaproteobacteria bacterium ADurb.BinA305]ACK52977.1 adenylate cyclase [Thauera aminoaromatica]ENO84206.1 adenylate cyclase [Thauera aminoaromatica S2]